MMAQFVARYAWADAPESDAYTISVIAGKTEDEVIRAFGGDPGESREHGHDGLLRRQGCHPRRRRAGRVRLSTCGQRPRSRFQRFTCIA
ncbi:hypothetical protein GCM10010515_13120 [Streptomyces fructofermentans]|uniref:Uncharacterized protein n=1 Tax=Streptomyces fructofermentans TaxID=152141 RepID=A0A918N8E9_9ACTN|nr:hypothetical protein GCM10010515_13120 [Streptomyces fructofermentans]